MNRERVGIIDIGSNSVRLVVYERIGDKSYRVIDESKESAKLSATIAPDGSITKEDIKRLIDILTHFRTLCSVHQADTIRAVATAAIRNATNGDYVAEQLQLATGLHIEIVSGEEEARLGFVGMINAMDIEDGYLIDIGGGSTELSLFRDRKLVRSVSFPFGAVNMTKAYMNEGELTKENAKRLRDFVTETARGESWLQSGPGLPLVGLGGTIRSLCKIDQKLKKYSFAQTHQYELSKTSLDELAEWLPTLTAKDRSKVDGLSQDRADIIVPGLIILHTLFLHMNAGRCLVSGAGLRDGVFYETAFPGEPIIADVLAASVLNLLDQHPAVSRAHAMQVSRFAAKLFDDLSLGSVFGPKARSLLQTAALLYRIGVSVHFYNFYKHTFYLVAHSRLDGLTHRESVLCALIASFKSKSRARSMMQPYKELLTDSDVDLVYRLGSLLQLAIALDRSETQPIADIRASIEKQELRIEWTSRRDPAIELTEMGRFAGDFKKGWGLRVKLKGSSASTSG
ncbi:Ppx/GppA phosphatase family protein [Paenibacillus ginsengarvi]|uniref:Ppx/GppA family phosphatase n=1 Tax=Paenibacillus ginsengarvi TaxID=400777 RepID=A0A3B0CL74_9BACL|nr:Ppx/GppA phosphatase family protein [Paenibacillus ginsengarvi]RKN85498.1 Ppx/GppA family phosphatase [Paenibacillus ginsengarvi]